MGIFHKCQKCNNNVLYSIIIRKDGGISKVCENCYEGEVKVNTGFQGRSTPQSLTPIEVTVDNKEYISLIDSNGHLINTKDLLLLANKIIEFANLSEIDEAIEVENDSQFLSHSLGLEKNENGLFIIPNDFVTVDRREFNIEKRAWSFKCGNCNEKTGTNTHKYYFLVDLSQHQAMMNRQDRACSRDCANVIAKDFINSEIPKKFSQLIAPLDNFKVHVRN
ncbi:hypothetical protein ACQKFO_21575 [Rossellomorea sp. NPDC071047]|uniref:hypothetical protein n=1 Tax=Rossellomorea sp. NPDC071047 TaxID=3390675 RepID=UPI003D02B49E